MQNLGTVLPWAIHLGAVAGAVISPVMQWVAGAWLAAHVLRHVVHILLIVVVVVGSPKYVHRARWVLKRTFDRQPGPPPSAPPPAPHGPPTS